MKSCGASDRVAAGRGDEGREGMGGVESRESRREGAGSIESESAREGVWHEVWRAHLEAAEDAAEARAHLAHTHTRRMRDEALDVHDMCSA